MNGTGAQVAVAQMWALGVVVKESFVEICLQIVNGGVDLAHPQLPLGADNTRGHIVICACKVVVAIPIDRNCPCR
jgi:hypothetical protein